MPGLNDKLHVPLVPCERRGDRGMPTGSPLSVVLGGSRTPRSSQLPSGQNTAAKNQAVCGKLAYDVTAARGIPTAPIP